jgi:hypothetical protein
MGPDGIRVSLPANQQAPSGPVPQVVTVATKEDLTAAKDDLRREMRLWLGLGSLGGTSLAGLLGAYMSGGAVTRGGGQALSLVIDALPF